MHPLSFEQGTVREAWHDPPYIRHWFEWEFHAGTPRAVLVIETTHELDPGRRAFDEQAIRDLITTVSTDAGTNVDHVRIIPAKVGTDRSSRVG